MPSSDRKQADRHYRSGEVPVGTRLKPEKFRRLEACWQRLGLPSRRQAIIQAIDEWLDRHENETTPEEH